MSKQTVSENKNDEAYDNFPCPVIDLSDSVDISKETFNDPDHIESDETDQMLSSMDCPEPTLTTYTCQFCNVVFGNPTTFFLHFNDFHKDFSPSLPRQPVPSPFVMSPALQHPNVPDISIAYSCDLCGIDFPLYNDFMKHTENSHAETIPQLDGALSEVDELPNVLVTSRTAAYSLNKQKQADKIRTDADIKDFEVTVNNNDQNATVKCSSGFYIQVAKSSFVTITKGSSLSTNGIVVTLDEVTETRDKNGLEATKLLHYSFKNEKEGLGGVAVHLHHSTRTIQIQGSHIMPDRTRAALWFLDNVTISRFKEIAKTKKYEINNFNEAAKNCTGPKPTLSNRNCQSCGQIFVGKAKPSQCVSCQKFFHKSTCLKDHVKSCKMSSTLSSSPVSSLVTPLSASTRQQRTPHPTTQSSRSIAGLRTSVTFIPPSRSPEQSSTVQPSTVPQPHSSVSATSTQVVAGTRLSVSSSSLANSVQLSEQTPCSWSATSATTPVTTTVSTSLTITMPSSYPSTVPSMTSSSNTIEQAITVSNKPSGKRKQKSIPVTVADHTVEILQKELSAAQSKIVLLDSEIKDKDQQLQVLLARLKILEEKQNKDIIDKYFPYPSATSQLPTSSSSTRPPPSQPSRTTSGTRSSTPACSHSVSSPPSSTRCAPISCLAILLSSLCSIHSCHHITELPHHTCDNSADTPSDMCDNKAGELEKLRGEIDELRIMFQQSSSPPTTRCTSTSSPSLSPSAQATIAVTPTPISSSGNEAPGTSSGDTSGLPVDSNVSVASIEEFMDDLSPPHVLPLPLNCKVPTSQP